MGLGRWAHAPIQLKGYAHMPVGKKKHKRSQPVKVITVMANTGKPTVTASVVSNLRQLLFAAVTTYALGKKTPVWVARHVLAMTGILAVLA